MKKCSFFILSLTLLAGSAHGFGKKPKNPEENTNGQAKPFRYVTLDAVTVPAFYFPNGQRADFNVDLNRVIESEINNSRYFRSQFANPVGQSRLAVAGGITSFEADALQLNLKIGWNKNGVINAPANATGEVDLRLTALSMDFMVYDRVTKQVYMSSKTDETLSQLKIQVKVNLANLNGSLDIFYKEVMAKAIQIATHDIMANLENHQNFDILPWETKVNGVDAAASVVSLGAGNAAGVKKGDVYSIYTECTPEEEQSGCFRRFLTDVKVDRTSAENAEASPSTAADSVQKVEKGDRVEVKPLLKPLR